MLSSTANQHLPAPCSFSVLLIQSTSWCLLGRGCFALFWKTWKTKQPPSATCRLPRKTRSRTWKCITRVPALKTPDWTSSDTQCLLLEALKLVPPKLPQLISYKHQHVVKNSSCSSTARTCHRFCTVFLSLVFRHCLELHPAALNQTPLLQAREFRLMQDDDVKVAAYQLMANSVWYRSLMCTGKQLAKTQGTCTVFSSTL